MQNFLKWFTGGDQFSYHTLFHCLGGDTFMMTVIILLCGGIFTGYWLIANKWFQAARRSTDSEAKRALEDLKWIFILCGICGYLWVCLEALWPAWRLYIFFLLALNFFTWRYLLRNIRGLESVYRYLQDRDMLVREIVLQKEIITDLRNELEERK